MEENKTFLLRLKATLIAEVTIHSDNGWRKGHRR